MVAAKGLDEVRQARMEEFAKETAATQKKLKIIPAEVKVRAVANFNGVMDEGTKKMRPGFWQAFEAWEAKKYTAPPAHRGRGYFFFPRWRGCCRFFCRWPYQWRRARGRLTLPNDCCRSRESTIEEVLDPLHKDPIPLSRVDAWLSGTPSSTRKSSSRIWRIRKSP